MSDFELLYLRSAEAINRQRAKDYKRRFRKLMRSRSDKAVARIIARSDDFQRGLTVALGVMKSVTKRMIKEDEQP